MWAIRDFIRDDIEAPTLTDIVQGESSKPAYEVYEGHYPNPNFQSGEKPYDKGGDIKFGEDGKPIVQASENLRFALTIPNDHVMPEKGWPIVLYGHGTGGDWKTFIETQPRAPAKGFAERGVAMLGIDQPLHGDRFDGDLDVEIYSFNFFNGRAGRSNFRQSAIDVLSQIRFVRENLKISAEDSHTGEEILFDPSNVFFMGHSHGGLSAGLFAPLDTDLKAIIMSGAGGGLSHTIMTRKTPVDIKKLMEGAMGIASKFELAVSHPLMGLIQNLVDATDPLSFAPYYRNRGPDLPPIHIMMTEGTLDAQTPPVATESLAAAARIPIMYPPATDPLAYFLLEMEPIKVPFKQNYENEYGSSTAFLMQFDKANHWAIFNQPTAAKRYIEFVLSAIETGIPSIK
jgi:predicted esterase